MPHQINQVFFNIIKNAFEALNGKGSITIKTWLDDKKLNISIKDTGVGIEEKYLKNLFQPTFTIKEGRVGATMGLAYCLNVIQEHNGIIKINTTKNEGTEVFICIDKFEQEKHLS